MRSEKLPNELTEENVQELIDESEEVRHNTFSTFTNSSVGAAILTDSGKVHLSA